MQSNLVATSVCNAQFLCYRMAVHDANCAEQASTDSDPEIYLMAFKLIEHGYVAMSSHSVWVDMNTQIMPRTEVACFRPCTGGLCKPCFQLD